MLETLGDDTMRRMLALAALLPIVACGGQMPQPYAVLPRDAVIGAGDPTRAAIIGSAYAFATPATVAGHPDAAARAAAQVEYLATEIPTGPRWVEFSPLIGPELVAARDELRAALGIPADAKPQAVVDGLYAASRAIRAGDDAGAATAMTTPAFTNGASTLVRLASLPALPRTRIATALTNQEMIRMDQEGRFSGSGDGGGKQ